MKLCALGSGFSWFCRPLSLQLPTVLFFFRSNQIFVALSLALFIILVHLGAITGALQPPNNLPEGGLLYQSLFGWMSTQPFYAALTASVLVFIQAVTVNTLADEFRLMGERNWFPGLFYALAASALPEFLFVTAPLVAATFIPISIWRIYNAFQKPNVSVEILDGAIWIGVASLFYPPALWLLVAAFAGFKVVRVFRLKERFAFLAGALVPIFLGWLWYFWADRGFEFWNVHWNDVFHLYHFNLVFDEKVALKAALLVLFPFIFLSRLGSLYRRRGNQAQKFVDVLFWFFAVGSLTVSFRPEWHWEHLLMPVTSMGILLALSFQKMHQRLWAEFLHLAILLFVFFIQFADYFLSLLYSVL
jgi:hypothetical protein